MSTDTTTTADLDDQVMHCREAQWRAIVALGDAEEILRITRFGKGKSTTLTDELEAHAVVEARKQDLARADAAKEEVQAVRDAALAADYQRRAAGHV